MAWFFFGEATDLWTWVGAALIFAGTTWSAHQEARLMHKAAASESASKAPNQPGMRV
jgi:drug/metabolite transporter (DMT)-like permease